MAATTAAELLIRIAADPSQAEASIQEFRSKFGANLGGLTADISQWSSAGTRSFAGVQESLAGLTGGFGRSLDGLNASFLTSRQSALAWQADLSRAFMAAASTNGILQSSLLGSFQLFDAALARNIGSARVWQTSVGEAFEKAAITSIGAIAKEAIVRALFSTALGFYLLAVGDFTGAGQAFESAAVFGAVGGAAALATRALAGQGSDSKSASGGAAAGSESSSGAAVSGSGSPAPHATVQIIFQGPVYGGQAGIDQLTREISRAVQERDVNLVAYTTVRQPATRA